MGYGEQDRCPVGPAGRGPGRVGVQGSGLNGGRVDGAAGSDRVAGLSDERCVRPGGFQ